MLTTVFALSRSGERSENLVPDPDADADHHRNLTENFSQSVQQLISYHVHKQKQP